MEDFDIYQWANQTDAIKNDLKAEIFLFTKHFTVYRLNMSRYIDKSIRALFLYDVMNDINLGAGTGLAITDIHTQTENENVLDFVPLDEVQNAQSVIEQIDFSSDQIESFNYDQHEIKKMSGVIVTFTGKDSKPFHIVKQLKQSNINNGSTAFEINDGGIKLQGAEATISIDPKNQILVAGGLIFAFNVQKFTSLFGYDPKKKAALDNKLAQISKQFQLAFSDGLSLADIVKNNRGLSEKLLKSDPMSVTQEQVIDQADKFQLALMTDDSNKIIIMDNRDAVMFANLLNDAYVDSDMIGHHYLATKKEAVDQSTDKQMNMGV